MDKYIYWLDNVLHLGDRSKIRLLEAFHTGEEIYRAAEKYLTCILDDNKMELIRSSKTTWDLDKKYEELLKKEIRMVTLADEDFPLNLRNIPDPPFCLYYKGDLPEERLPGVAIIGARECSEYGRYVAQELGDVWGKIIYR